MQTGFSLLELVTHTMTAVKQELLAPVRFMPLDLPQALWIIKATTQFQKEAIS
jgi:hypothetical protein